MIKISKTHITVGKMFLASHHTIWDLITDTFQWPEWGPTVKAVRHAERYIRKGSRGQVLTVLGLWLPFEIIDYEHSCFWSWKVASIRATGHRVQPMDTGGCCLWFEVPIIAAPYLVICQIALNRIDDIRVIEIRKYSNYPPAERITVGRVDSNDIVFSHGAISKVHAYLVKTEPGVSYEIIDVNSTNGTRVNDQELPAFKNQTLVNLDQIEFGKAVRAVYLTPRGFYEFVNDLIRVGMI